MKRLNVTLNQIWSESWYPQSTTDTNFLMCPVHFWLYMEVLKVPKYSTPLELHNNVRNEQA